MEVTPPQKPPAGLTSQIKAELQDKASKLSTLADQCKSASPDEAKKMWNEGYHSIVGNSAVTMQALATAALAKAATDADRAAVWDALAKGYHE